MNPIKRENEEPIQKDATKRVKTKHDELFEPFWLIPEHLLPFRVHLSSISESDIKITSPPEMPRWYSSEERTAKIGMALRKVLPASGESTTSSGLYDSAYVCVTLFGRYKIVDSKGTLLLPGEYLADPAYDTQVKLLQLVLCIVKGFLEDIRANTSKFVAMLYHYCADRRAWEVKLVKKLVREGLVVMTTEDIKRIEDWRHQADRIPPGNDIYDWYREDLTILENLQKPLHGITRSIEDDGNLPPFITDVITAVHRLKQKLKTLEDSQLPEQLLIEFDDDGNNDGAIHNEEKPQFIPPPDPDAAESFYHWCLERHGRWARKGAFNSSTCHEVYQLARLDDVKCHTELNLHRNPWGLPAHSLYDAMKGLHVDDQYYTVPVREFLLDLEPWYFRQPREIKERLQTMDILGWSLGANLSSRRNKLLGLPVGGSME
ncbi:hypothetical protein ASPVEDRAFT_450436 [Aspergillus versicolor CBS 583.65]|uniref:Uncharacterized protein n=1 Tax=Aspergillus versicolor CBS 583.65 TaxID=1036611 RepID=A0A1L9P9U1_ASPVE|nr:uncharacterized protein ASPVEDRAFT_450436 [Aspergillus versicolor CBS 583.65]OJI98233.1 hypothetical protein ASPVEDRAFT_450436 [Aspergillus versicolor CBS 583.65]